MPATIASVDVGFLTRVQRRRRVGVRRRRLDLQSLLTDLDLVFPQPLHQQELQPTLACMPVDGGVLLPLQAHSNPVLAAACEDALATFQQPIIHIPSQQQHVEVCSVLKKVKWHDEQECIQRQQEVAKKSDGQQPPSATHSASSSQGVVFAPELSSPERSSQWVGHHDLSEELA